MVYGFMSAPFISLLMPTRGRPELAERFIASVLTHSSQLARVEVVIYVDDDDTGSHHIASELVAVKRIIGPRINMGACTKVCLEAARGDIIVLANDDMVIRTTGWDAKLAELHAGIPDGIYLAYANDLFKDSSVCTFPILSRATCKMLGEPFPAAYRGAFIDTHLMDIFRRLQHAGFDRVRYLKEVVFEHLHHRTGKAPFDATYAARKRFDDDATYVALAPSRQLQAMCLLAALLGKPPQKYSQVIMEFQAAAPRGFMNAIEIYTQAFLLDTGLPWQSRCYQWVRFIARYLAANGWLRPFVR
jgi:glycosyltransferase involved in cell wall biosynthesis